MSFFDSDILLYIILIVVFLAFFFGTEISRRRTGTIAGTGASGNDTTRERKNIDT
ncbi:hypothetical protein SAMN06296241_0108 [Salinimicrobium sediminis]|uniref:Uncharacterized protein n=1 Tax=Salinimicrobium sediminis TaxID=1343891 RepID=A0A285X0S3_9FLAO|nr:hypothetical protein [Salinimicrobium sediminis]SOC78596.1 hypothetical protein SAMN06296241_0108 [Salinimicrobium sediminis]